MAKQMMFVVLVAMVMATSIACNGGPTGPSKTCQDPKASNFEGPLPCEYSPPTVSSVRMITTPVAGRTYSYGFVIPISVGYEVSGNVSGVKAWACLSVDGVTYLACKGQPTVGNRGSVDLMIGLPGNYRGQVTDTHWVISFLSVIPPWESGIILAEEKIPWDVHFE